MAKVIWSDHALNDIEQISEYISKDSPDRAALFVGRLIDATDNLQEFQYSGREIPEVGNEAYREVIYGAYRVMHKIEGENVLILAVVHSARDWKPDVL